MAIGEMSEPKFLNYDKYELDQAVRQGLVMVKKLRLRSGEEREIKDPSDSYISDTDYAKVAEGDYFIKQNPEDPSRIYITGSDYEKSATQQIYRAIFCLKREKKKQGGDLSEPTAEDVVKLFSGDNDQFKLEELDLEPNEDLVDRIQKVMDLFTPKGITRAFKGTYEQYKKWYDEELPDFVIKKHFVIGEDADGKEHSYTIKKGVQTVVPRFYTYASEFMSVYNEETLKDLGGQLIQEVVRGLDGNEEAITTFKEEMKKLVAVTRAYMEKGEGVPDFGGGGASNIFVLPSGQIRLIDTNIIGPTHKREDQESPEKKNTERKLRGFEYVANHIDDPEIRKRKGQV